LPEFAVFAKWALTCIRYGGSMKDEFYEDGKNVDALFKWLDIRVANPYGSEH
jgi:hypothetical protein